MLSLKCAFRNADHLSGNTTRILCKSIGLPDRMSDNVSDDRGALEGAYLAELELGRPDMSGRPFLGCVIDPPRRFNLALGGSFDCNGDWQAWSLSPADQFAHVRRRDAHLLGELSLRDVQLLEDWLEVFHAPQFAQRKSKRKQKVCVMQFYFAHGQCDNAVWP